MIRHIYESRKYDFDTIKQAVDDISEKYLFNITIRRKNEESKYSVSMDR